MVTVYSSETTTSTYRLRSVRRMKTTTYTTLIFHNTRVFLFFGSVSFKLEDYLMSAVLDYSY